MSRNLSTLTQPLARPGVFLNRNLTQKILLTMLIAVLAAVPLWLGLERAHSAPAGAASPPAAPAPIVSIDVPAEVLIGEDFQFEVKFKNTGAGKGFAPYVDLYLPAWGADGNAPDSNNINQKCDGISFLNAETLFETPSTLALPAVYNSGISGTPPCPVPYSHPFNGATLLTPTPQYQLVVLALPFGSFDPTQPEIIVKVTAHLSDYADAGWPLTIYAKGGFRYGSDEFDNHPTDPLIESAPVYDQTTPTVLKIKKEYLGPEDEAVSGPNFVNSYPLTYKITVDIADQQKINNLVITDNLPNNLQFQGNVQVKIHGTPASPVIACSTTSGPLAVVITPPLPPPGGTLTVKLCSAITGSTSPDDVVVTFDFYIPNLDANGQLIIQKDCSNAPVAVKNDILAAGDWDPLDPRDAPPNTTVLINSNLTNVDHLLNAKCLAIQKSVSMFQEFPGGAIGATPGDILRYELNFQVSDYFTIGKLAVTDFLADGQTFLPGPPPTIKVTDLFGSTGAPSAFPPGTVTINTNQLAAAAFCPVKLQNPALGTIISFNVSSAMNILPPAIPRHDAGMLTGGYAAGSPLNTAAKGTIVFYAKINDTFNPPVTTPHQFVDKHDPINNCVSIKGAVYGNLPRPSPLNANLNVPTMVVGAGSDRSAVQTPIVPDTLKKMVYAVKRGTTFVCGPSTTPCSNLPNAPEEVRPGDQVTFRIEKYIPSSDAETVVVEDWLPVPIFDVNDPDGNSAAGPAWLPFSSCVMPGPGAACWLPSNSITPIVTPVFSVNGSTNGISFNYGTFNDPANQKRKIDLVFTLTVTNKPFADGLFQTNEVQECENNSFGVRVCQTSIAQVKVREPRLSIKKGLVATDNPHGEFTPALSPAGIWKPFGTSCPAFNPNITSTNLGGLINSSLSNVDAGDSVTFAIAIENTGGAPAYNVELADIIPLGPTDIPSCFEPAAGGLCVTDGHGTPIPFTTSPGGHGRTIIKLGTALTPYSATTGTNIAIITFNAKLLDPDKLKAGCCDNTAQLTRYTSTPEQSHQPIPPNFVEAGIGGPFADTATICVGPRAFTKCIVKTSEQHTTPQTAPPGTPPVAIGEILTFRIAATIPEGLSPNFQVRDLLPPGLTYLGNPKIGFVSTTPGLVTSSTLSGAGLNFPGWDKTVRCGATPSPALTFSIPPTEVVVISGSGGDVTFKLGNVSNSESDADREFAVIEFNALVDNVPGNVNGTTLTNKFDFTVDGQPFDQNNAISVSAQVVEPNIVVNKTFTPPNPVSPASFTVTLTNTGTADAFDVHLTDVLPAGLSLSSSPAPSVSVSPVACAAPTLSVSGNTLTVDVPQLRASPGCTVKLTFFVQGQLCATNIAQATYTSLPGGSGSTPVGTQPNSTGSVTPCQMTNHQDCERVYNASGQVSVTTGCTTGCATPPANMVGWWPLNEQAGATSIADIMGGHNGTPMPGGTLAGINAAPGKVGGSLFITNNNVTVPSVPALQFGTSNFSIDAWFGSSQPQLIGSVADTLDTTAKRGYALFVQGNRLKLVLGDGTAFTTYTSTGSVGITSSAMTWHHVAVTVDRSNSVGTFYIDGAAAGTFTPLASSINIATSSPLLIGGSRLTFPTCVCEFNLDEVEIFNSVVPASAIQSIFKADKNGKCTATIKGMKFNDLDGNGVNNTGEPGLGNWTIKATDSSSNIQTTTTNAAGSYSFTVPAPGTYTVSEVLAGWTQTAPTSGTYAVTVAPGQVVINRDFGNKKQNQCDLKITKTMKPNPLVSGQQATATISVTNVGTAPCHGPTQVAESMPPGLSLFSASVPGGNCVIATGVCTYPPGIAVGQTVVFTYVFNVTAQPGTSFENCAKLKNSEDQNQLNNGSCIPVNVSGVKLPDLTIQKKVQCSGNPLQPVCKVTLTIGNNGPGAFNGILTVQDVVTPAPSPGLSWVGSSNPAGWSCSIGPSDTFGCASTGPVPLAAGQSTSFSVAVMIPGGHFKNCASVKGYTQFPYNASTLVPEVNVNNNQHCVPMP